MILTSADACVLDPTNCQPVLTQPVGIARDASGTLYVSDSVLHVIVAINPTGEMHLLAGNPRNAGFGNGAGTNALFNTPQDLAVGTDGRIYVADIGNHCVRVVTTTGVVTTLAGAPDEVGAVDGLPGTARFYTPASVALDSSGNVLVIDTLPKTIRKILPDGSVSTLAGKADPGLSLNPTAWVPFFLRYGPMTVDQSGRVYALFYGETGVRVFAPDGPQVGFIDLSKRMTKTSQNVSALAVDSVGNLYASGYVSSKHGGVGALFRISPLDELVFLGQDIAGAYGQLGPLTVAGTGEIFAASVYDRGVVKFTPPVKPIVVRIIGADYQASGTTLILDAVATGTGPLGYQWSRNGVPEPAATNSVWEITSVQATMSGSYSVTVADQAGQSSSFSRTITIYDSAPVLDVQPVSGILNPNTHFLFHTVVRGSLPNTYQWFGSGILIPGETNADMVFPTLTNADSRVFTLVVSNAFGTVTSEPAKMYHSGISVTPVVSQETVVSGYSFQLPNGIAGVPGSSKWNPPGSFFGTYFDGYFTPFTSKESGKYVLSVADEVGARIESVPIEVRAARPYRFETIIGKPSSGSVDGPAGIGLLNQPSGIVYTAAGLFIADTGNHTIRKVYPDGRLETIAGFPGVSGNIDGFGRMARFNSPRGLAADAVGNLYVADSGNRSVRKVDVGGEVTTVVRWPAIGSNFISFADGPVALGMQADGSLLVGDEAHVIRRVGVDGALSIVAGVVGDRALVDGSGTTARFDLISGMASGPNGSIYIADGHLRRMDGDGTVITLAGTAATNVTGVWLNSVGSIYIVNGSTIAQVLANGNLVSIAGASGWTPPSYALTFPGVPGALRRDGVGMEAGIFAAGLAGAPDGNLYAVDGDSVRKVTPDGVVTTICGAKSDDGRGLGSKGRRSLAADETGGFYSANSNERTISYISPDGAERIWLGRPFVSAAVDGDAASARFVYPTQLTRDRKGVWYLLDNPAPGTISIRSISPAGVVKTLASVGSTNLTEPSSSVLLSPLGSLAVTGDGLVYFADLGGWSLSQLDGGGSLTPVLTNILCGPIVAMPDGRIAAFDRSSRHMLLVSREGNYSILADLSDILRTTTDSVLGFVGVERMGGLAVDATENIIFSDYAGGLVWRISPSGSKSLVSGVAHSWGTEDGPFGKARWFHPTSLAVDSLGSLIVADSDGPVIRRINSHGDVQTLTDPGASLDGPHEFAELVNPVKLVRDHSGNLFVADRLLNTIRKIDTNGVVSTFAGFAWVAGNFDGVGTYARFSSPGTLAIDGDDNIYVGDWGNNAIRKITPGGVVTTVAGPVAGYNATDVTSLNAPISRASGLAVDRSGNLYFAGQYSGVIRKITPGGLIELFAGNDWARQYFNVTGAGEGAPEGAIDFGSGSTMGPIAIDSRGDLYASVSHFSSQIYQFSAGSAPMVIASRGGYIGVPWPPGTTGEKWRLSSPSVYHVTGMSITPFGEVVLVGDNLVQKIDAHGWLYTVAGGIGGQSGSSDGTGVDARFSGVSDVTVDDSGALYVVDAGNRAIRRGTIAPDIAPALTISQAGSRVVLDWLSDPADYVLESSDSLSAAAIWSVVSERVVLMENRNFLTVSITEQPRYFRLAQSN